MTIRVEHGDCLEVIPQLVACGVLVDAVVTDPPYHLFAPRRAGIMDFALTDGGNPRQSNIVKAGLMNQTWDGGDIAFQPETWAAIGAPLKPGGYLLAFGGSRTHHRIWCAIEDVGFVIQDTIMWFYGSGFPKGRTQLKPAHEPICVAYKPGGKRVLQIDECRIATGERLGGGGATTSVADGWDRPFRHNEQSIERHAQATKAKIEKAEMLGRWPANVCHDGSDEVMEAFAAFGERKAAPHGPGVVTRGMFGIKAGHPGFGDTGTAARFFYAAKASKVDRAGSKHPTVKPVALMRWLVRLVTPPGGTVLDPFAGSGTMAVAAIAEGRSAILIEREAEYIADIRERVAHYEGSGRHSMAAKHRSRSNSSKPMPLLDFSNEA